MYYSKTLKQFLAGIKPEVKNDADEKKEKELIKKTLLGHKNEPYETIRFEVNKVILKKLQSKRKAKSINDYINQLIMKDLDNYC